MMNITTPTSPGIHSSDSSSDQVKSGGCPRNALLKRPRFLVLIGLAILFSVWLMYRGIQRSQELLDKGGRMTAFSLGLRYDKSWFNKDRPMDISDAQWSTFRDFLPLLFALGALFVLLRRIIDATVCRWMKSRTPTMIYYVVTALAFSFAFMGTGAIFPLLCFAINFAISRVFRQSAWNPILTWAFNVTVLVTGDYYNGFPFSKILFWNPELGIALDRMRGLLPWEVYFKLLLCRFISFNLDFQCHLKSPHSRMSDHEIVEERKRLLDSVDTGRQKFTTVNSEHRFRQKKIPRQTSDYNVLNFFVYVFYLPLYIAGPLCTFNAFVSYVHDRPQQEHSWLSIIWNATLVAVHALAVDIMLHYNYMHMFSERRLWRLNSPMLQRLGIAPMDTLDLLCMYFTVLLFMFMKFLVLWRLFRFWAIADGINPPENMNRCIFTTYSVGHFWRAWHRSLHEWCVAYIYVPLGGSKHRIRNNMIVFFFMAIWHDLWMRWIAWATFNVSMFILELVVGYVMSLPSMSRLREHRLYPLLKRLAFGNNAFLISISNMAIMYSFTDTLALFRQVYTGPGSWWQVPLLYATLAPLYGDFSITLREVEEECGDKKPF